MNLEPVFDEIIRHEELPDSTDWLPPLEMDMLGPPGTYPIDKIAGGALLLGGIILGLTAEFTGAAVTLILMGLAIPLTRTAHHLVWGNQMKYFRALHKHTAGKEFLVTPQAIYISGSVLASNGYHFQVCHRDRERLWKMKGEYLRISHSRLRAFGRRGQFLALYPADGAAYTKFYYFESYNEHVLDHLEQKLSSHLIREEVSHLEIPATN